MISSQVFYLSVWFVGLFTVGTLLCLLQAKWRAQVFFRSSLWTKILYWIPIFITFLLIALLGGWAMLTVWLIIIVQALREYKRQPKRTGISSFYILFFIACSVVAALHFFITKQLYAVDLLILICFGSVLSDVLAYFMGTFIGNHRLPSRLNSNKSWEGVAGQIIGALLGAAIVIPVVALPLIAVLALAIGFASALGDLLNSAAKRSLMIKDWGQTIPGHGGVLDRFSSLSAAFMAGIVLINILS